MEEEKKGRKKVYLKSDYGGEIVAKPPHKSLDVDDYLIVFTEHQKDGSKKWCCFPTLSQHVIIEKMGFTEGSEEEPSLEELEKDPTIQDLLQSEIVYEDEDTEEPEEYYCFECGDSHYYGTAKYFEHLSMFLSGDWNSESSEEVEEPEEDDEDFMEEVDGLPEITKMPIREINKLMPTIEDESDIEELISDENSRKEGPRKGAIAALTERLKQLTDEQL